MLHGAQQLAIGSLFVIDRGISVWRGGWSARILAAVLVPELLYDMYLDVVYLKGIFDITFARNASWGHVDHSLARGDLQDSRDTAEVNS